MSGLPVLLQGIKENVICSQADDPSQHVTPTKPSIHVVAGPKSGLDVERLERALRVIDDTRQRGAYPHLGPNIPAMARLVAREYEASR